MSSETSLLLGWIHIPSTDWSSGGRRPTYWKCGGGSPRREAEGRLMANVPPLGKTFCGKKYQTIWNVHFWVKNKVVRTEILHILVPKPSRGDLYLTISRPSRIFPISSQSQFWDLLYKPVARRGNGLNFRPKFGPFLKIQVELKSF